jgi:23S rRNA (cytosine1962-C5)-methyltransferase
MNALYLKKHEERRVHHGHPWVYSNEVDTQRSPLPGYEPGEQVEVRTPADRFLGMAYVNPHSLICARVYSRRPGEALGPALLERRLQQALALRERIFPGPYYRLVYGESDGLSGLVVDRYGELLAVQLGTAGMERQREAVLGALQGLLDPAVVVLRNDLGGRELEGLAQDVETVRGEPGEWWELEENGARFRFSPLGGQKTGWYYDHRLNRARLGPYVRGRRVLDAFSYGGAWGVQAALAGAERVLCLDASAAALEQAGVNAALNGVAARIATVQGDAFKVLKELREAREEFDLVILDPPAFIKRRKDVKAGLEAYQRLNELAMRLLGKDGFLVSSSCSYHLQRRELADVLHRAARHEDRVLRILEQGHQAPDHPVHPGLPESDYLKTYIARVLLA